MNIQYDFSLKTLNTFKMEVACKRFVCLEADSDIQEAAKADLFEKPCYILGGGSNTLFTKDYEGTILQPVFKGIEITENNADYVILRVAAGELWDDLITYCIQHRLYGLENLIGIPGLVGSAPVQNIGAYGMEVSNSIDQVEGFFIPDMQDFILANEQCQFGYRDSVFKNALKGRCLITYVRFKLSKQEHYNLTYRVLYNKICEENIPLSLENVTNTILQIRNSKLPDISEIGCAGSFFQNPIITRSAFDDLLKKFPDLAYFPMDNTHVKLSAGQLIEKAGWKGKTIGNAGIYPHQALVVVNYGNASPDEIKQIYEQVIQDVYQQFSIYLNPEVNIL